ncbi:MAG: hypothetical protein ACRDRQ_03790 [Pseudonocardiaceae bacterium]
MRQGQAPAFGPRLYPVVKGSPERVQLGGELPAARTGGPPVPLP